jgi:hypothetical protein
MAATLSTSPVFDTVNLAPSAPYAQAVPVAVPSKSLVAEPTIDAQLLSFLQKHDLEDYATAFAREGITFKDMKTLTDSDLKDLGLPMGPRKTFLKAITPKNALQRRMEAFDTDGDGNLDAEELKAFMEAEKAGAAAAAIAAPAAAAPAVDPNVMLMQQNMQMMMMQQNNATAAERATQAATTERAVSSI